VGLVEGFDDPNNLVVDLIAPVIIGIILGLIGNFIELRPVETIRVGLAGISSRIPRAARIGLVFGLCFGLVSVGVSNGVWWTGHLFWGFSDLVLGSIAGLVVGLMILLSTEEVETRTSPNQGPRYSVKIALVVVLILSPLVVGLLFVLFPSDRLNWGFTLSYGLIIGLLGGLLAGGLFSLKHFVLRSVL